MAIKLADVIENLNTSYPVVDTGKRGVYGFYNGAATDAIQPIELLFVSDEKTAITSESSLGTGINLTTLPYSTSTGTGLVTPDGDRVVLSQKGGIVTVLDSTLADNTDTVPANALTAAYLVNTVAAGNVSSASRASIDALSELVQQFNRYTEITPDEAYLLSSSATEEFYIAGYDTERKAMRRMTLSTLIGYINSDMASTLESLGFISSSNAGSFGSSGAAYGDINGDGITGTNDLLVLLAYYGSSNNNVFTSAYTFMAGSENSGFFSVSQAIPSAAENSEFIVSDFTTFDTPDNITFTDNTLNWTSTTIPNVGNDHYIRHEGLQINVENASLYDQQAYYVKFTGRVLFNAEDTLFCLVHIKATYANAGGISENIFYMNIENGTTGSSGISPSQNNFTIGNYAPIVMTYTSVPASTNLNPAFTPFFTTNTLLGTHTPATLSGGEYLEDYEVRLLFTSISGNVQVRVEDLVVESKSSQ